MDYYRFSGHQQIIFFKKRKKAMRANDVLSRAYEEWLREGQRRCERNILRSFQRVAEEFYKPELEWDNNSKHLPTHSAFLIHTLSSQSNHLPSLFAPAILILNFILKRIPKFRIPLTKGLLTAIRAFFCNGTWDLAGNALWLVCRCLQGSCDRREALGRLEESGLVEHLLREGKLDVQAEKAVAMLLYFMAKNQEDRTSLTSLLLTHEHCFQHTESIKHVLATLREAGLEGVKGRAELEEGLSQLLVRFMGRLEVPLSDKMLNLELIAFSASNKPSLCSSLQVPAILESKISAAFLPSEPMLDSLIKLVELQAAQVGSAQLLQSACGSLTNNVVARRVFILLHEQLNQTQLLNMIGVLPCAIQRLLHCPQERQNGLKLLICLKRAINRVGLSRVFWCFCRTLVQQVASYRRQNLPESCLQLLELFEEIVEEQTYHLFTI